MNQTLLSSFGTAFERISPRPENKRDNYNAIDYPRQCISFKHFWFIGGLVRTTMINHPTRAGNHHDCRERFP